MFKNNRSTLAEAINRGRTRQVVNFASLMAATILVISTVLPVKASPAADSSLTFTPSADAQVTEATPDKNYGNTTYLQVDGDSGARIQSYLLFNVTGISGSVSSAKLRVYDRNNGSTKGPILYGSGTSWNETDITWSNRPSHMTASFGNPGSVEANAWVEYDVTSAVTADGNYSFVLVADGNDGLTFSAREDTNASQLVVTTTTNPLPAVTPTSPASPAAVSAPAGLGIYDDTDPHWSYSASWTPYAVSGPYNNNIHYTTTTGASASFIFQAPAAFIFYYAKSSSRGSFQVWVDGSLLTTIDPYATTKTWQNKYISPPYTDKQSHTVKIKNTGVSGQQADVDAIEITSPSASGATVLVGAGDIASCGNNNDEATAKLLDNISGTVFTAGDDAYSSGTATEFANCYDPTWGRHKSRTKPVPGNHEYKTSGASGYFNYFKGIPSYYAYDLGSWRVYALNSEIDVSATSAEVKWLKNDLAANPRQCVLAYWHEPRWSSGSEHGSSSSVQTLWSTLYNAGAELVINGHDHEYERFAPMNASGSAVSKGMREFVVGTGGAGLYKFGTILSTSQVHNSSTNGVLKLTLRSTGYDWQFIPVAGKTFTDSGSSSCR